MSALPPRVISFVYIAWKDAKQGLPSRYRRIHNVVMSPRPREISLLTIFGMAPSLGHQAIILHLRVNRGFRNAKLDRVAQTHNTSNRPRHKPTTAFTATSRWAPSARKGHRKPSETERRQCALRVLDHLPTFDQFWRDPIIFRQLIPTQSLVPVPFTGDDTF